MWEEIMKKANKKRNPVARTLKTFTQKIVPDKKKYDRKKNKKFISFQTEIVTGTCDACKLHTLLVGIDGTFFRCISCGEDLEQKVNGVIKYLKVDKNTDLTTNGKEV
jgi:hypothetical protein